MAATFNDDRFLFHSRIATLIVAQYAEERHKIAEDDPDREEKIGRIKETCANDLKRLYRYIFGRKNAIYCKNCSVLDMAMQNEAAKVDDSKAATPDWEIPAKE